MLAQLPLWWGWLSAPGDRLLANPFTGGHVWAADVVGDALWSVQWPDPTDQAGFPGMRSARYVAWPVLLLASLLRPLWTSHAVVHVASWLGPALGGVGLVRLARALRPDASGLLLGLGGLLFALSPVTLGAALSGQVENTQLYVLPLLLLLGWRASWRPILALLVPLAWLAGALTSPYLAMMAAFCAPWVTVLAWRRGAGSRQVLLPLVLALPALLLAAGWLDPGAFSPEQTVYRPSYAAQGWPELWTRPLPVAAIDTLLTGNAQVQVKAMVLHQPYLGLVLLACGLMLGRHRATWALPVVVGVLLALGPRLAWGEAPVTLGGRELILPAQLVRWLDLPLAHGGQYYRAVVLAHLGLAGMVATGELPGKRALAGLLVAGLGLAGGADALRSVRQFGLPWPTWELPRQAWAELAAAPGQGAILHLPMHSTQLPPCHPLRLAGHPWHGRALSDLPRAWTGPPEHPLLKQTWAASAASPRATMPARSELASLGFAYAVVDLPAIPERRGLLLRLQQAWGPPDGSTEGLTWWRLATVADPGAR